MGAWGLRLFQSDHDYDRIVDFTQVAGLVKLEREAVEKAISQGKKVKMVCDLDRFNEPKIKEVEDQYNKTAIKNAKALHKAGKLIGEIETMPVHYAVYARVCSDVERAREHLDSGVLAKMLADAQKKLKESYSGDYDSDGYNFILLGACGMSLGCTLSKTTITLMKKHYNAVGLMRDAKKQMERALADDTGYVNGKPWDFGSLGLKETLESGETAPDEDRLHPTQINVQAPGADAPKSPEDAKLALAEQMMMLKVREEDKYGKPNQCAGCGAEERKGGGELLQCAKCKRRKYCSADCQKAHWKYHKLLCKDFAKMEPGKAHLKAVWGV